MVSGYFYLFVLISFWQRYLYEGHICNTGKKGEGFIPSLVTTCFYSNLLYCLQMNLAKQIFSLLFWIILIRYKVEKERSVFSAELKRAVGDSQTGGCTFSGMLFQRATSCECAAAAFSVLNNLHSETAKSSIFMGWWDHRWHAATSASSLFTPHPFLCKFQVLISWD